jgi:hypothetical protein
MMMMMMMMKGTGNKKSETVFFEIYFFHKRKCLLKSVSSQQLTEIFQCNEIRFILTEPTVLNLIASELTLFGLFTV